MNWRLCTEENKVICINNKLEFFCVPEKKREGDTKHCEEGIWKLCFDTNFLTETNSWLQIMQCSEKCEQGSANLSDAGDSMFGGGLYS